MPFMDAYIPEGALSREAERKLVAKITDPLLEHEGVDPNNEKGRHLAWVFVHRPEIYVAGAPPRSPAIASSASCRRANTTTTVVPR
jgi:hypothetical protein